MTGVATDELVSLQEAARSVCGRAVPRATVQNWTRRGVKGVKLWTLRIGGKTFTTRAAVRKFLDALNPDGIPQPAA